MAVCKFFLEGRCKFGNKCKFEHPGGGPTQADQTGQFARNQHDNQNSYGVFGRPSGGQGGRGGHQYQPNRGGQQHQQQQQQGIFARQPEPSRGNYRNGRNNPRRDLPFHLNYDIIREDLENDRPMWIMSSYGPGRDAPRQLFGGFPLEQSPEEIRTLHYLNIAAGNPQQSAQMEAELAATANSQTQTALGNLDAAIQYIMDGSKEHPNRIDICKIKEPPPSQPQQTNGTATFGQQPTTFGQPAAAAPAFGQPAPLGQAPAGFGAQQPAPGFNTFGAAAPTSTPIGQQPSNPPTDFGQPAAPFGQPQNSAPSGFGNVNQPSVQQNGTSTAFGAPTTISTAQSTTPFGQNSTNNTPNNGFGASTSTATGFGTSAPSNTGFGSTGFGSTSNSTGFGSTGFGSTPSTTQTGFGGGGGGGGANHNNNTILNPSQLGAPVSSYTTRDSSNRLLTWKSQPVIYLETGEICFRRHDGSLERIWFPDGPPTKAQADDEGEIVYPAGGDEAAVYSALRDRGSFAPYADGAAGLMPEVPPRVEDILWDV